MKTKQSKLTRRLKSLVDDMDQAAQYWGWQRDQGTGSSVDTAEKSYNEAKAELVAYLIKLQAKVPPSPHKGKKVSCG